MNGTRTVSVVIANRNGAHHLRLCLPSLLAQSYQPLEIVVVDNNSTDDSKLVAEQFGVRWIGLTTNVGLAPALNRGAAAASGEFLLFVNNDMRFDQGFVEALVRALLDDANTFAADGMQYDWDGTALGHTATRLSKRPPQTCVSVEIVPGLYMWQEQTQENSPALMASAACMLVRRGLFRNLDGFDEKLPLGSEDIDICWRAWIKGLRTVYVPRAICWHRVGSSCRTPEGARLLFLGTLKGRLVLATKLLPARYALLAWATVVAGLGKDLLLLRMQNFKDRLATLWAYGGFIPEMVREKAALFRGSGVTPEQQLELFLQLGAREPRSNPLKAAPCEQGPGAMSAPRLKAE